MTMTDIAAAETTGPSVYRPRIGEQWKHTRTGGLYVILGYVFNTITDQLDVLYAPKFPNEIDRFSRQLLDHEKAFLSANEDGSPRFCLAIDPWGRQVSA